MGMAIEVIEIVALAVTVIIELLTLNKISPSTKKAEKTARKVVENMEIARKERLQAGMVGGEDEDER